MPKNQNRKNTKSKAFITLEYYQRPFLQIHKYIANHYGDINPIIPPIRERFWQCIPHGEYSPQEGRDFLNSYLKSVEDEMAKYLTKLSLAYCLHLYRRLSPGPIGNDQQKRTIGLTRAILEAAIQKYAGLRLCNKIATSATVPIEKVLGGLLMSPEFEIEREFVVQNNQLVLTDFSSVDLLDFYDLEKLAYEIWRTAAALRTTGKGAPLKIVGPPICFSDDRSLELDFLVSNYDDRLDKSEDLSHSSSGVVFIDHNEMSTDGFLFLPTYNLDGITGEFYNGLFSKLYNAKVINKDFKYNFAWFPFNLRKYRKSHLSFASSFYKKYKISVDAVLTVIAALLIRILYMWLQTNVGFFTKYHQRAYEGPYHKNFIVDEINKFIPEACIVLEIQESSLTYNDIKAAIDFWTLDISNRMGIDLSYSGPHYLFLPVQEGHFFIDYAWIYRRLHDLFVGVWISDQNFKGETLELAIQKNKSVLPITPCKIDTEEKRQIDYSAACGSCLIIAECRVKSRSIAFDRGDPHAIKLRREHMIEPALSDIDEKAKWLATHQIGTNFNITSYDYILPVAISPFVEFIPSQNTYYWISKEIPRVLTLHEFDKLLADHPTIANAFNKIALHDYS